MEPPLRRGENKVWTFFFPPFIFLPLLSFPFCFCFPYNTILLTSYNDTNEPVNTLHLTWSACYVWQWIHAYLYRHSQQKGRDHHNKVFESIKKKVVLQRIGGIGTASQEKTRWILIVSTQIPSPDNWWQWSKPSTIKWCAIKTCRLERFWQR